MTGRVTALLMCLVLSASMRQEASPLGRWYQTAIHQKAGRIRAAGITKEVVFEPVNGAINDRIDEAYRTKYAGSPPLKPMIGGRARAATVRVMPRG